jgi:hypothetical protein
VSSAFWSVGNDRPTFQPPFCVKTAELSRERGGQTTQQRRREFSRLTSEYQLLRWSDPLECLSQNIHVVRYSLAERAQNREAEGALSCGDILKLPLGQGHVRFQCTENVDFPVAKG